MRKEEQRLEIVTTQQIFKANIKTDKKIKNMDIKIEKNLKNNKKILLYPVSVLNARRDYGSTTS